MTSRSSRASGAPEGLPMLLLLLLPALAAVAPAASSAGAGSSRRTETPLTFGWRFKRGDLPFNGGPLLCSDQLEEVAFPTSLKGKACALGPREKWSLITVDNGAQPAPHLSLRSLLRAPTSHAFCAALCGAETDLPADCSRACCTNPNCSLWSWYNNSDGTSGHPAPTRPAGDGAEPYRYGDCYLGYGQTDPATQCSSKDAQDFVGGARAIDPLPSFPPRVRVAAAEDVVAPGFDDAKWGQV
eukprot:SAG22_NODE_390_length_11235_cov_26.293732_6_plen_242_part_00